MRFADTRLWPGLEERRDPRYEQARALVERGVGRVITTNHVVGETWILLRMRSGHSAAVGSIADRLKAFFEAGVVHFDEATQTEAWRWLRARGERKYSFVYATAFALKRRRRIREAGALDGGFNGAGVRRSRRGLTLTVDLNPPYSLRADGNTTA